MSDSTTSRALRDAAIAQADGYYLDEDHPYGCAETVFMTLKRVYGLEAPDDPSAALAFNGGIAYSGGPCGAITGGAMAVGMLAGQRLTDHQRAKTVSRALVREVMALFLAEHGAVDCRTLIGYDLQAPGEHQAFIDSGLWREACAGQIRTVVGHLAGLADDETWAAAADSSEADSEH